MEKEQLIELLKSKIIIKKGFKHEDRKTEFADRFLNENISKINSKYYDFIYKYFDRDNIILTLSPINGGTITSYYAKSNDVLYQEIRFSEFGESHKSLCHEIGHAVDSYISTTPEGNKYKWYLTLTKINGSSLYETLDKEVHEIGPNLIKKILNDYQVFLRNEFHFDVLPRYLKYYPLYKEKKSLYIKLGGRCHSIAPDISERAKRAVENGTFYPNLKRYQEIEKILEDNQACLLDKKIKNSLSSFNIMQVYTEPVIESLIPLYDADVYGLYAHAPSYYTDDTLYSQEFFANFFCYKLIDDEISLYTIKLLFPETYKKCEELFDGIISTYPFGKAPKSILVQNL